ncbi:BTB domain-containing protein [Mycena kentingensis (nom. inval.)]|nr:BTB domain-containing protein [Mycena kentingensis (nom. inval.)]
MSTDERPAKRAREDSDSQPTIIRSPDYWFDDGSIILQVETTQFRVGKSLLAMHSTVFRDMLSVPLPADEPLVDGCPVVVLAGDKADDWMDLLDVIYPKSCFLNHVPTIRSLGAVLRLTKKYDIPSFRAECLVRLKSEFPTEFDAYNKVRTTWTNISPSASTLRTHMAVIALAREMGLYSVLPTAFYGIIGVAAPDKYGIFSPGFSSLADNDRATCLAGYAATLVQWTQTTPHKWLESVPSAGCSARSACETARKDRLLELGQNVSVIVAVLDHWDKAAGLKFCSSCRAHGKEIFNTTQKECWDKLPSYFGLPPWEELRKMDFE